MTTTSPVPLPAPASGSAAAPRSLAGRIASAIFATIGVVATIALLLFWGLHAALTSGDAAANGARDGFINYANDLTGVADTTASIASSNAQQPFNVDATVRLDDDCTRGSFERSVAAVQKHLAPDDDVQVHPVIICSDLALQVSPDSAVTDERMTLLRSLLALPSVTGAAVTFPTTGYDRFVDDDNDAATLSVRVDSRDALVATMRELRAHPPLDLSVPSFVVDADKPGYADLAGVYRGGASESETRLSVDASTATLPNLLSAVEAIMPHVLHVSTSVTLTGATTTETTMAVAVASPEQARAVEAIMAASGADLTRFSVSVGPTG